MTEKVTSYFNIFECGRNILYQHDVMYQQAFMATPEDEYYKEMTKSLIKTKTRVENYAIRRYSKESLI